MDLKSSMFIQLRFSPAVPFNACSPLDTISMYSNSQRRRLFPIYSLKPIPARRFRISVYLGRERTRSNYLRRKLAHQFPQFQQGSHLENSENDSLTVDIISDDSGNRSQNFNETSGPSSDSNDLIGEPVVKSGKKKAGESVLWDKLESWVEQYKKDTEFWGIGTGTIFTIYEDSESKIDRVVVNDDEIRKRNRGNEDLDEVTFKLSLAHDMAIEMENNKNVIPRNSSVVKFVVSGEESWLTQCKSHFTGVVHHISSRPGLFRKLSLSVVLVLCGIFVVRVSRMLFSDLQSSKELTKLEEEMLRRKQRSRKGKISMVRGSVEVIQDPVEPKSMAFRRPLLDKEEIAKSVKAMASNSELAGMKQSSQEDNDLKDKIKEIRMMARRARELDKRDSCLDETHGKDSQALKDASKSSGSRANETMNAAVSIEEVSLQESNSEKPMIESSDSPEVTPHPDASGSQSAQQSISRKKLRIISSAEEAREYLSKKHPNSNVLKEHETVSNDANGVAAVVASGGTNDEISVGEVPLSMDLGVKNGTVQPVSDQSVDDEGIESNVASANDSKGHKKISGPRARINGKYTELSKVNTTKPKAAEYRAGSNSHFDGNKMPPFPSVKDSTSPKTPSSDNIEDDTKMNVKPTGSPQNSSRDWIEKNFHEFEPIIKKIGLGFTENYQIAKEKSSLELVPEMEKSDGWDELEWMKDEELSEIVFQVRDNELSGRDPFHQMTEEKKLYFFSGLDRMAEAENKKLLHLHEYLHSNIENLDYGADGISLYDPPEKIIPRWKVPPADGNPELSILMGQRKDPSLKTSKISEKTGIDIPEKPGHISPSKASSKKGAPKTVIQGSDGSVRAGKRSGKEFWQHTKKWSQGFMESYNAESDPEVKAVMKDIGKDLDRWITEKEIKEAADFMEKLSETGRDFLKQKLEKVKREMQLYGPQAVVSKYREYSEEKEVDHLWWLDLPYILCIEMYTVEEDEERVGLYSLEMAADLELDPKQYHVIAFEDAGDCKNLCYIIQAHMEMLGKGNAFVIARPPKDAFREAKANGFSVTVVRKGQVQMDVDKTLEEVEESLVEVGSKIYHDKITKERSVDVNGLMKGVFGFNLPAQRKRLMKKLRKIRQ